MRILLVSDWKRERGGSEVYITFLRDSLRAAGDEVRLLTSSTGTAGDGTADYVAYGAEAAAAQTFLQVVNPFAVAEIRRARDEFHPDVVLVTLFAYHLSPAVIWALRRVPTVLMVLDYKPICPLGTKLLPDDTLCQVRPGWVCRQNGCLKTLHWLRDQPRYALLRAAFRRANCVLACGEWLRQTLARHEIAAHTMLLPVPRPTPNYRREPANAPDFLFCGRFDREKGIELLLRTFARLHLEFPSARLRLVGRGPLRATLEETVTELGLADVTQFLPWQTPDQVERQMASAWAVVVPSLWAEPLGLVAIQAIVRGVPVIASGTGGLAEIVEEGRSGLLFANGDGEALLAKLQAVASGAAFPDRTLAADVIAHAQEKFGVERHIAEMRRVFEAVAVSARV